MIGDRATLKSTKHLADKVDPHYKLHIKGRTKGDQVGRSGFQLPVISISTGTKINNGIWVICLKEEKINLCITGGRLLQRKFMVPKLVEY